MEKHWWKVNWDSVHKTWQLSITKMSHTTPCFMCRFNTMSIKDLLRTLFINSEISLLHVTKGKGPRTNENFWQRKRRQEQSVGSMLKKKFLIAAAIKTVEYRREKWRDEGIEAKSPLRITDTCPAAYTEIEKKQEIVLTTDRDKATGGLHGFINILHEYTN